MIFALALFIAKDYICNAACSYLNMTEIPLFRRLLQFVIYLLLATIWFMTVFMVCRNKRYRYKTGRNFMHDSGKYKRSYAELVEYFQDSDPHKLDTSDFKAEPWRSAKGLIFGTDKGKLIKIPSNSECNIAVFGPPGSGKTSGIAIINAISFQGSVLAVDVKGDLYNYVSNHTNRKIVRFCPDSPTALTDSVRFDPFAELKHMDDTDKKLYLESMATVLIADEGGSDGNYFTSRARKMFQGITHLILHGNPDASFPDVIHAILQGNVFDWVTKARESDCEAAKELLSSLYGNNEKNVTAAYDALTTALVHFSNPVLDELLSNKGHCVSIKTLENGNDLYLQISQEHLDAYAPLFTLLIQSMSTAFTKRPDSSTGVKNRPILMLLDEFPQLTFSYKLINSNLSTLRSKSVICMVIQQNLSQLEYRYQPTGARSILGNCNYQIILGSNDINSSKVFSDTFGVRKVLKISNSETIAQNNSTGRSVQESTEKIFSPEYFGDLSANNKMVIYFKGKYCECQKLNCYKD
jgi:type IV secretory pathway TraG/TraD family ATPase VirD4